MNRGETLLKAIEIAKSAGAMLRAAQDELKTIERKSSEIDLVTQYDEAAEALIVTRLVDAFPEHSIVAEEGAARSGTSPFCWHVDPLDGTTNFAHGIPVYCVSLALYEENRPVLAVIFDPSRDECFQAIAGRGAFLESAGRRRQLKVSANTTLLESILATGFPYDRRHNPHNNLAEFTHIVPLIQGIRRAGSAALDLASVAAGRIDGYWEYRLNSWDVAAGVLLVAEAGGHVTGISGDGAFHIQDRVDLIASNGLVHAELAGHLNRVAARRAAAPSG